MSHVVVAIIGASVSEPHISVIRRSVYPLCDAVIAAGRVRSVSKISYNLISPSARLPQGELETGILRPLLL